MYEPLSKEDVSRAVEGRSPSRIPLVRAKWWGEGLADQYGERLSEFDKYPNDVVDIMMRNPVDPERMALSWDWKRDGAHDARTVISDWSQLPEFIGKLPNPKDDPTWEDLERRAEQAHREDRYLMWGYWNLFFERPWGLRGMQRLMMDYYLEPDNIRRLHAAMTDVYTGYAEEARRRLQPHGFWTSDDLGHQTGPMMDPSTFHELIYPYYCRVGDAVHRNGMHFWLHSCGDNTLLLPDLIHSGVDVFHPVQKHTMDERSIAEEFGGRITFLTGIDVQHVLQEAGPDGVREEVRFLIDTFDRPDGRMCIGAGNGIVSGTPFENIDAFLDEALRYGAQHRSGHQGARVG